MRGDRDRERERESVRKCQWSPRWRNGKPLASFNRDLNERRVAPHLVASLGLSDEDESVGADDGDAEVDEDNRALRADIPGEKKHGGG